MKQFICNKNNQDFFRFWFAQLISQFGDRVHQMALVGLITVRSPGSPLELAKLLAFTIIPVFLIGPVAGVYVDRWDRRSTLFVCDFIRCLLVLVIAFYLMKLPSLVPLYAAVFIIFSFSRFYVPAKMSLIPEMVDSRDLHVANSLVTVTGMIALVLGALSGGLIVEYGGAKGGFLFDAVTFFISGLLIFSINPLRRWRFKRPRIVQNTKEMVRAHKTVRGEINEGLHYIGRNRDIRLIFILMSILFAACGAVYVVIIIFIQQSFHSVTRDLGFLAVPLGIGLFLGSLAYGRWGQKISKVKTMFWSLVAGGAMTISFTVGVHATDNHWLAMALAGMLGLVCGPIMIAANTVVHMVCSEEMSGKVFAALEFIMHLAFLLAMLISAVLAEYVPRFWILSAIGVIFMVVGLIGVLSRRLE